MRYNGKFKVAYGYEPEFFVNTKKKIVTCKLCGKVLTPFVTNRYWLDNGEFPEVPCAEVNGFGVAKCADGDVFDEARGKRIALARAENDCQLQATRYLSKQAKCLEDLISGIDEFTDKAYGCCAHNDDYIDSLVFESHPQYKKEVKEPKRGQVVMRK